VGGAVLLGESISAATQLQEPQRSGATRHGVHHVGRIPRMAHTLWHSELLHGMQHVKQIGVHALALLVPADGVV